MASAGTVIPPEELRAAIAARLMPGIGSSCLGEIALAPHQVTAARRIAALLSTHGGALLADDVGLGKTFVALAVARAFAEVLIIAPAGLRMMWLGALARSGVTASVVTYEALSRSTVHLRPADIVILDEAHHARSATARRHAQLAQLTAGPRTLLLTATPVPNRTSELRALFALFLGERAMSLPEADLRALIVRRTAHEVPAALLPPALAPEWIDAGDDTPCLHALQQLPPPVAASDAGEGGALLLLGLLRQWSSSRAALSGALRRRRAIAVALESSLAAGRMPTIAELGTWQVGDEAVQLAFPELAPPADATPDRLRHLRADVRRHHDAVSNILALLRETPDPDTVRAARIIELRARHPGERIVCFTSYARTAAAYWRLLRHLPGVAHLASPGGNIASGRLCRSEVLARFAPAGQRVPEPRAIERISLLVTTDLLSEGVDLRDATVVVHLDLPWSPARLEQRVGRCRRLGSIAPAIAVYTMRPPARPEAVLALEQRLRSKLVAAGRMVGVSSVSLPGRGEAPPVDAAARRDGSSAGDTDCTSFPVPSGTERMSRVLDRVASWNMPGAEYDSIASRRSIGAGGNDSTTPIAADAPLVCAVVSPVRGWLALVSVGEHRRLYADIAGVIGDDAAHLARAVAAAEGGAAAWDSQDVATALQAARRTAGEWAAILCVDCVDPSPRSASVRSRVLARIGRAYDRTPPHARPRVAALAAGARRAASGRLPQGVERALAALCEREHDDEAFVSAVAALDARPEPEPATTPQVDALIVLIPPAELSGPLPSPAPATPS